MTQDIAHKFAALGHRKIKSLDQGSKRSPGLLGSLKHDLRAQPTPNADETTSIYVACAETDMQWTPLDGRHPAHAQISDPAYWVRSYLEKLASYGINLEDDTRKDAVLVEQQHAHFSPEVFRGGELFGPVDKALALRVATAGLAFQLKEYDHRLLLAYYHPDEYTPHFGGYIVPVIDDPVKRPGRPKAGQSKDGREAVKRWRLSAKSLFNPKGCSLLQTRFAAFLRSMGFDVVRGIAKSRTGFALMQLLMRFLHSPVPDVPAFVLPPELTDDAPMILAPHELRRQVLEATDSWRNQIIETIIPPLRAKALERDNTFRLCRGYQRTALEKEDELQRYRVDMDILMGEYAEVRPKLKAVTQELDAIRAVPRLYDVAVQLIGRGHIKSVETSVITFNLPDGMALEIDSEAETYRRQLGPSQHTTVDSVGGSGVAAMIKDITGWNDNHSLCWIEAQWGPRVMATCLGELAIPKVDPLRSVAADAPTAPEPVIFIPQLVTPTKRSWPSVREVLTEGYRFRPTLIDALAQAGKIGANRFGDLLILPPRSSDASLPQVFPLLEGAVLGDGIYPASTPFTLGSGSAVLAVVSRPLDAVAFWECIPDELRLTVTVAVVPKDCEPTVWTELREAFPDAVLLNGLVDSDKRENRGNRQACFSSPTAISPAPAKTWSRAWTRQFEDELGATAFRAMKERLVDAIIQVSMPVSPLSDPV